MWQEKEGDHGVYLASAGEYPYGYVSRRLLMLTIVIYSCIVILV